MNNLATIEGVSPLASLTDVKNQVAAIHEMLRTVMKSGEHYMKIPGCGDKQALTQSGAQKLGLLFQLSPRIASEVKTDFPGGHREYDVRVEVVHRLSGAVIAEGVGICTTMEAKYRWRTGPKVSTGQPVPREYWDTRKTDPIAAQRILGGRGYSVAKDDSGNWEIVQQGEKVENDNPAEHYNTVRKMAYKRAFVHAVINGTAASDIFTQDLDDNDSDTEPQSEPIRTPQSRPSRDEAPPPQANDRAPANGVISDAQAKRFWAIAKQNGKTDQDIRDHLVAVCGVEHTKEIPRSMYENACKWAESKVN